LKRFITILDAVGWSPRMSPSAETAPAPVPEITGLTVEFSGVRALDGVGLDVAYLDALRSVSRTKAGSRR
jgi:hypothetical protein